MRTYTKILALSVMAAIGGGCRGGGGGVTAGAGAATAAPAGAALEVAAGPSNPGFTTAAAGARHTALGARIAASGTEDALLESITIGDVGGGAPGDVTAVSLIVDTNGNGAPDGGDAAFGAPSVIDPADRRARFTAALPVRIPTGGAIDLFAVYDLAAGAAVGASYQAAIETDASIAARGADTDADAVITGAPVMGGVLKVLPAIAGGSSGASGSSGPAAAAVPVFAASFKAIALPARDLAIDPVSGAIFASTPKGVIEIDPSKAALGARAELGAEPGKLAISSDGTRLYAAMPGTGQVACLLLPSLKLEATIDLGLGSKAPLEATDMAVSPADATRLLVALADPSRNMDHAGVALFEAGKQVGAPTAAFEGGDVICFHQDGVRAFGSDTTSGKGGFWSLKIDAAGPYTSGASFTLLPTQARTLTFAGGVVRASTGEEIDADKVAIVRALAVGAGATSIAHDETRSRSFFLDAARITAFDAGSAAAVGEVHLPKLSSAPASLCFIGNGVLAFRTGSEVIVVETKLAQ